MLSDADVCATIAVSDLDKAKKFYGDTLGLEEVGGEPGGVTYKSGKTVFYVYPSEFAGTNKATTMSWRVKDLEKIVDGLKAKGVAFEKYDSLPNTVREGEIHIMGDFKVVWFKDPDGNILAMDNGA